MSCGWLFHFFSSWHAACSWFRTCQGSRKPQRNKSGACCNQRQLWHLTAFSAQWHHVNKTSSGVSTASLLAVVSGVGSGGSGSWWGLGVRCWGLDWGIKGASGKNKKKKNGVSFLDPIEGFGSRWVEGDQLRSSRTLLSRSKLLWWKKDPTIIKAFCGAQIQKKKKKKKKKPLFAFRDSSIYSMWCL